MKLCRQVLFSQTQRKAIDVTTPVGQRRSQRHIFRSEKGGPGQGGSMFVHQLHLAEDRSQEAHNSSVDLPDGGPDVVQQPREVDIRGDFERVGHTREGPDKGAAVVGDG